MKDAANFTSQGELLGVYIYCEYMYFGENGVQDIEILV